MLPIKMALGEDTWFSLGGGQKEQLVTWYEQEGGHDVNGIIGKILINWDDANEVQLYFNVF